MQMSAKLASSKTAIPDSSVTRVTETAVKPPSPSGSAAAVEAPLRMQVRNLNFYYGKMHALHDINLEVAANRVTALIGPSGCGKSTLLRTLNRMHETVRDTRARGRNAAGWRGYPCAGRHAACGAAWAWCSRSRIPFPSPFSKISPTACASTACRQATRRCREAVEQSLRRAALWDEVKDQLHKSAYALSGGQQQRLCIARALAVDPEVLLLDEPCSALDPVTTAKIEELLFHLKENCTMVIVTHNMQQAARVSDSTAFMLNGDLIEFSPTPQMFTTPTDPRTEAYITGRFG